MMMMMMMMMLWGGLNMSLLQSDRCWRQSSIHTSAAASGSSGMHVLDRATALEWRE